MQLLISCPNCHTSYQVDEKQVNQSDGQARCHHCNTVFNAMLNAQPLPDNEPRPKADTHLDDEDLDVISSQLTGDHDDHTEPGFSEELEHESDHSRELSSLFVPDRESELLTGPDDPVLDQPSSIYSIEKELEELDLTDSQIIEPLQTSENQKSYSGTSTFAWSVGIIVLLLGFILQFGWFYRDQLLQHPTSRQLIDSACAGFDCRLPPQIDSSAFEILERKVAAHQEVKGILSFSILFANIADFKQPAPGLTLSLFDSNQELIARRSFTPQQYLGPDSPSEPMLNRRQTQKVFLNLEDPGQDVTGFELSFF